MINQLNSGKLLMNNQYSISQNFLSNKELITKLIKTSNLDFNNTILDIGAGKGSITEALSLLGYKVIAYEVDGDYYNFLRKRFEKDEKIKITNKDFLKEDLSQLENFSIFSNIPFNLSTKIITKLLIENPLAENISLVLQEETAHRIVGEREGLLISLLILNNYEPKIIYKFKKTDFTPSPKVSCVLMQFIKRKEPLVQKDKYHLFLDFICFIVMQQKPSIEDRLKKILTDNQIKIMLNRLKIEYSATLYSVSKLKYFEMYKYFLENFKDRISITSGSYKKYQEINNKNQKNFKTRSR